MKKMTGNHGTAGSPAPIDDRPPAVSYLIALFVAGPTLALVTLALPHALDANTAGVAAAGLAAYLMAAMLGGMRRRLPAWGLEVAVAYGTLVITVAVYFSGSATTSFAFFYLWALLYAAYFFPRPRAAIQLGLIAVGYAIVLSLRPEIDARLEAWVVAVGTLAMAGALFTIARERVDSLVARLATAADTDPLTGLVNRRGFSSQFEAELERGRRFDRSFGLIVGDLDNFKAINDRLGHESGDDVLVSFAGLLRAHARRLDTTARIGGEEFALLLPGADSHGASIIAERIREAARRAYGHPRHRGLTVSFGVCSYPADGDSMKQLLRCADESLYAAKELGRDRTVRYREQTLETFEVQPDTRVQASN
jgi:diguanylate cyclase (GGDEF)-like protein